ncbi:MAG: hypothetical protein Sylvanvirus1_17 [Sylvanvirus sp.]|uniref:Uncharacterized protein n=1 Tax=Sylvanvirus sp. TaxID=2487774 RepID=A0A3G5AJB6_9VIRU|nr:MAG: hypothetical protein Sylvanvirus1_17 [Sylvanvirus sp.]
MDEKEEHTMDKSLMSSFIQTYLDSKKQQKVKQDKEDKGDEKDKE